VISTLLIGLLAAHAHPVDGHWELVQTEEEVRADQVAAIDKALQSWPGFAVALARSRIVADTELCHTYTVQAASPTLAFRCGDYPTYVRASQGADTVTAPDGKTITSRVTLKPTLLRIRWSGDEDGMMTDTFEVEDDTLRVEHRLTAPMLPRAIRWTVRYRRATSPPAPAP
jgi:hypothetical protein